MKLIKKSKCDLYRKNFIHLDDMANAKSMKTGMDIEDETEWFDGDDAHRCIMLLRHYGSFCFSAFNPSIHSQILLLKDLLIPPKVAVEELDKTCQGYTCSLIVSIPGVSLNFNCADTIFSANIK
eukprot:Awhi_evm1s3084